MNSAPAQIYKVVPEKLLAKVLAHRNRAGLDPFLCAYQQLFDKYHIPRRGVIHLGGHIGQELPLYAALSFHRIVMVEPLHAEYERLSKAVASLNQSLAQLSGLIGDPPARAYAIRCAVTDRTGAAQMYRTQLTSLSALSRPVPQQFETQWRESLRQLPWRQRLLGWWKTRNAVRFDTIEVPCRTLDDLSAELPADVPAALFTYLRMNIQGSELNALRGGEKLLESLRMIDLEINLGARYEGAPQQRDIDEFLRARGFDCVLGYRVGLVGNLIYVRAAEARGGSEE